MVVVVGGCVVVVVAGAVVVTATPAVDVVVSGSEDDVHAADTIASAAARVANRVKVEIMESG